MAPATRDPYDDYLVAFARITGAQAIVSSDRDLLEAQLADVAVLRPADFLGRALSNVAGRRVAGMIKGTSRRLFRVMG